MSPMILFERPSTAELLFGEESRIHRARERLSADLATYAGRPRARAVAMSRLSPSASRPDQVRNAAQSPIEEFDPA